MKAPLNSVRLVTTAICCLWWFVLSDGGITMTTFCYGLAFSSSTRASASLSYPSSSSSSSSPYQLMYKRLAGIWKLHTGRREVGVVLNEDGTFFMAEHITGYWDIVDNNRLVLASKVDIVKNRVQDCIWEGDICVDNVESSPKQQQGHDDKKPVVVASPPQISCFGSVCTGKFVHNFDHPDFFDELMGEYEPQVEGRFQMKQLVSDLTFRTADGCDGATPSEQDLQEASRIPFDFRPPKFTSKDLYGKEYVCMITPSVEHSYRYSQAFVEHEVRKQNRNPRIDKLPHDIQAMGTSFFRNNTFAMLGVRKTLRGKFTVDDDRLLMKVTVNEADIEHGKPKWLIQARQAATRRSHTNNNNQNTNGVIYSEGPDVSRDDERLYDGRIGDDMTVLGFVYDASSTASSSSSQQPVEPYGEFFLTPMGYDSTFEAAARKRKRRRHGTSDSSTIYDVADGGSFSWTDLQTTTSSSTSSTRGGSPLDDKFNSRSTGRNTFQ